MYNDEFKYPHCNALMNSFHRYYCGNENYFACTNCMTDILIVKSYIQTLSSHLNLHNKISKLYYYDDKEIEWIEIDENKELKIEYKR